MSGKGTAKQRLSAVMTSTPARHAYLVLALLAIIIVAQIGFRNLSYDLGERLEPVQLPAASMEEAKKWLASSNYTDQEQARLWQQLAEIANRRRNHLATTSFFYKNYFISLSMALLTGIAASVCLAIITRRGWGATSPYVITCLVVLSGAASLFVLQPAIYKQEQNIADNKALYLSYAALENEVLSKLATGVDNQGEAVTAPGLIHAIDGELNRLNNIAIGFDTSRVPVPAPVPAEGK